MNNLKVKTGCTPEELVKAQKLRFEIFNGEMKAGLQSSFKNGLDQDEFDDICDHLIIVDQDKDMVIGTYRMLLDSTAKRHKGFYSAKRFDLSGLKDLEPGTALEVGRSCIHKDYRNRSVLTLLWHSIAQYSIQHNVRYILGCPSIFTMDEQEISRYFSMLKSLNYYRDMGIRAVDEKHFIKIDESVVVDDPKDMQKKLPSLFQGYLDLGAKVCGFPALNREFGTTVFFIVLDLMNMNKLYKKRFLGDYLNTNGDTSTVKNHAIS